MRERVGPAPVELPSAPLTCPACNTLVVWTKVRAAEWFRCPSCRTRLVVSSKLYYRIPGTVSFLIGLTVPYALGMKGWVLTPLAAICLGYILLPPVLLFVLILVPPHLKVYTDKSDYGRPLGLR